VNQFNPSQSHTPAPANSDNFFSNMPSHSIPQYQAPAPNTASLVSAYTPANYHRPPSSQVTRGHMAFGVPMSGISTGATVSRGRARTRGKGIPINTQPRTLHALLILIPRDVSADCYCKIVILTMNTAQI
jgi:hypothetical protein